MPKPRSSVRRVSTRTSSSRICPAVTGKSPATQFSAVLLPPPRWSEQGDELALLDLQIQAFQRVKGAEITTHAIQNERLEVLP